MAISEKILDFGKNKGTALGACEISYLKWLATHPMRLRSDHRHFAIAAKALLEKKEKIMKGQNMEQIILTDEEYREIDLLTYLNDPCYEEDRKRRSAEWAHHPVANVADAMARLEREEADNSHNGEGRIA